MPARHSLGLAVAAFTAACATAPSSAPRAVEATLPPPAAPTAPAAPRASSEAETTIDGIALGAELAPVLDRAPYHAPCDVDPFDKRAAKLHFWTGGPCRDAPPFPSATTVAIVSNVEGEAPPVLRVSAIAWAGGHYFDGKSRLPVRIGDRLEDATRALGAPSDVAPETDLVASGELRRVAWAPRLVHALVRDGVIVALAVGDLTSTGERQALLRHLYGHHIRYLGRGD